MSATPPEQQPGRPAYGYNMPAGRMPIPGNAEFAVFLLVEVIFVLIWIIASSVNTATWFTATTALTFGYMISRGIAKAGKVLEQ
jgi:hypothetical protein